MIVNEFKGEKIDIVEWLEDFFIFVVNVFSFFKVLDVIVNEVD